MSLSFSSRMDAIESLIVSVSNQINELPTFDENDSVREQIFTPVWDNRNRVIALEEVLDSIERILSEANGT